MKVNNYGKLIFESAGVYSKAAKYLNNIGQNDMSVLLPSQINASLSLELYFKSLYFFCYETEFKIDNKHSHDFHKLFIQLPEEIKKEMVKNFISKMKVRDMTDVKNMKKALKVYVPIDLETNLVNWSFVFVKMRYFFDKQTKPVLMMFFPEIEEIVVNQIKNYLK